MSGILALLTVVWSLGLTFSAPTTTRATSNGLHVYSAGSAVDASGAPTSPSDISVWATASQVQIRWTDPVDVDLSSIDVLRSDPPSLAVAPTPLARLPRGTQRLIDNSVVPETSYTYVLRARDTEGHTRNGPEISVTTTAVSAAVPATGSIASPPPATSSIVSEYDGLQPVPSSRTSGVALNVWTEHAIHQSVTVEPTAVLPPPPQPERPASPGAPPATDAPAAPTPSAPAAAPTSRETTLSIPESVSNAAAPGMVITHAGTKELAMVGADGKRYIYPNEATFRSWYVNFSAVRKVSRDAYAALPMGGYVTVRPGTWLVKVPTDPKVYAVEPGGVLRWIETEARAAALYGPAWNQKIIDIPTPFWMSYTTGEPLGRDVYATGTLVRNGERTYYVDQGTLRPISGAVFSQQRLQRRFVHDLPPVLTPSETGPPITLSDDLRSHQLRP